MKKIHLLCNAHLDPVWLWEWPEGAAEALSTFRAAAAFCSEYDDFIFCHNEAILYRWVEEFEPSLFRKIRGLVRKKKWNILGGWYLQPDCNMPSGESFVRHILLGKLYFKDKFGVDITTAANLDSFGHTRGLVQILAKSGFQAYLFCRPDASFAPLPADEFLWVGYDGSTVLATRVQAHYNSQRGGARAKVEDWMRAHPDKELSVLLWGIGNHGGGASRKDLEELKDLQRKEKKFAILHSTADAYFEGLKKQKSRLPRHGGDINPWAPGCYTTMARVKQRHRRLENEFYSAEKMATAAAFQGLMAYPEAKLEEALRDLAFSEFHDILPGSAIGPGEEGAVRLLDHGLEICSRIKAKAFFVLAAGEKTAGAGEIPIFVYNPHPFPVRTIIVSEFEEHEPNFGGGFLLPRISRNGTPLPSQPEKELSNLSLEWRKRVAFATDLEPGTMNRFVCRLEKIGAKPETKRQARDGDIRVQTPDLDVVINSGTGLLDRFRVRAVDILAPNAAQPLVLHDNADPWGMSVRSFRNVLAPFKLMDPEMGTWFSGVTKERLPSVRVIEDGAVRTIIESVLFFDHSHLCLRYLVPKRGTEIEIEVRVYWNEKDKMLKLAFPLAFRASRFLGQAAYGLAELPVNGDEAVSQKWLAVIGSESGRALTIINDGIYGSDFSGDELRLSLVRSPAHSADPGGERPLLYQDRHIPRIDQGERSFRFWINGGRIADRLEIIDREALIKNEQPYVLSCFPPGKGRKAKPFIALSDKAVQVTALKKAEKGGDLIIRLFEPTGRRRTTDLILPSLGARTTVTLNGFELKTLRFRKKTKKFLDVDLLEEPV